MTPDALSTALRELVREIVREEVRRESAGPSIRLLSVDEARQALGSLGRSHIYDLISSGRLRSVSSGRRRLIPTDAIAEYVRDNEATQS